MGSVNRNRRDRNGSSGALWARQAADHMILSPLPSPRREASIPRAIDQSSARTHARTPFRGREPASPGCAPCGGAGAPPAARANPSGVCISRMEVAWYAGLTCADRSPVWSPPAPPPPPSSGADRAGGRSPATSPNRTPTPTSPFCAPWFPKPTPPLSAGARARLLVALVVGQSALPLAGPSEDRRSVGRDLATVPAPPQHSAATARGLCRRFQGAFCNLRGCDRGLPLRAAVDVGSVRVRVSPRMAPAQQGLSRRG